MKSFSFAKALTLGCLVCLTLPIACGDDDDDTGPTNTGTSGAGGEPATSEGGAGGAAPALMIPGTSDMSKTIKCGTNMCSSVSTVVPTLFVDPCCAADACGVSTDFLLVLGASFGANSCQAVGQKGDADAACPDSAAQKLPVNGQLYDVPGFVGCCRAETGTCGVVVDKISASGLPFASPKLGCVDSAPFFGGKAAASCGSGAGGSGSGGGGPVGGSGPGDAGGNSSVGGAGGAAGNAQ